MIYKFVKKRFSSRKDNPPPRKDKRSCSLDISKKHKLIFLYKCQALPLYLVFFFHNHFLLLSPYKQGKPQA